MLAAAANVSDALRALSHDVSEHDRNASGARVNWMFTTEKARAKMGRAYQNLAASPDPGQAADPTAKPS